MSNNNEPNKIIFSMVKVSKFYDKNLFSRNLFTIFIWREDCLT